MKDLTNSQYATEIANIITGTHLISEEDSKFLSLNVDNFKAILENSYMWRTKGQKLSIISDQFHPTLHSKFHQAILEAKVQFTELMRLSVDAEKAVLDVEEIQINLEEIQNSLENVRSQIESKKLDVEKRRKEVDLRQKMIEMNHYKTAAKYRMKEIRQWKEIQDNLYSLMKDEGRRDEDIWNKESAEVEDQFFQFLNKLVGVEQSTDAAEVNNLVGLARYAIVQAEKEGMLEILVNRCSEQQLETLRKLGCETGKI